MDGRATLFAIGGTLALVLGLATAAVGFYVSAQTQCDAGAAGDTAGTGASGGCPGAGTWLAYGGGTTSVVGFFALLYGWVRFVYG
jgi:hypothetical protein